MPYITSSIIIQLLIVVIPRLETLKEEGQSGQAKLTQYTRYLTIALAMLQSTGIVALARSGNLIPNCTEKIIPDDSFVRLARPDRHADRRHRRDHVARRAGHRPRRRQRHVRADLHLDHLEHAGAGQPHPQPATRRLRARGGHRPRRSWSSPWWCSSSRRSAGSRCSTPSAWSAAGCTAARAPTSRSRSTRPASSRSSSPARCSTSRSCCRTSGPTRHVQEVRHPLLQHRATTRSTWPSYFGLIIFFTYFYVAITFNPVEVADNMKKYGGFVPGIRPGPGHRRSTSTTSCPASPASVRSTSGLVAVLPLLLFNLTAGANRLPVRRHRGAHRGRRRTRDREADREPADAAQLRRLPAVMARLLLGGP